MAYEETVYPALKWEHRVAAEILQKRAESVEPHILKVLEIGSGSRVFAESIAPSLLPPANMVCVEYSDTSAAHLKQAGFNCVTYNIHDPWFTSHRGTFDAICMFQVLEHLCEVDALFARLAELVVEGGDLLVAVPNPKQRRLYDRSGVVMDVPPTHVGRWNRRSFEILGRRHGWVVVSGETEPQPYLSRARQFLGCYLSKTPLAAPLRRIASPVLRRRALLASAALGCVIKARWLVALSSGEYGSSLFVHLRRQRTPPGDA